jgi:hypothetical protein
MISSHQEPQRSRAAAGICYVAVGGIICTVAVLLMRFGVSSIPWHRGYFELALETVVGIAGFFVFMGFVQLVIAFILKMRERRRSHLVQSHLTGR